MATPFIQARLSPSWFLPSIAALLLAGCGGEDGTAVVTSLQVAQAAAKCTALASATVSAGAIGLPTQGAVVTSAALQAADPATGMPEYCKVLGSIKASNAADPSINFEVNLPTSWNVKALQYGGGGLNGSVVTGLTPYTHAPVGTPTPLAMGYATFGSDSGHQGSPLDGSFGLNAQALVNYSGESVKRTHDTAKNLIQQYYEVAPRRTYHIGGSKGGHEGLVGAQRYGADYDGVIAYYPASQNPMLVLSWYRMWQAAYGTPGGEMNVAKQRLLKDRVLGACDSLDGAADGVISDTRACEARFDVNALRCPSGADEGDACLSDTQIGTLKTPGRLWSSPSRCPMVTRGSGPIPCSSAPA